MSEPCDVIRVDVTHDLLELMIVHLVHQLCILQYLELFVYTHPLNGAVSTYLDTLSNVKFLNLCKIVKLIHVDQI